MKTRMRILSIIIILMYGIPAFSQNEHEISITGGIGVSSLRYHTDYKNPSGQAGGLIGFNYSYFFSENWGVTTGLEFSLYRSKIAIQNVQFIGQGIIDREGHSLDYYSTVEHYKENQNVWYLNIPLMVQFQTGIFTKHQFYISGGIKAGIPVEGTFKSTNAEFKNKGYFPAYHNELETEEFMGFGTFTKKEAEGDFKTIFALLASLETGIKWNIGGDIFYTGIYLDYGLNDISKKTHKEFIEYNIDNPANFNINGIQTLIKEDIILFAIGLKLKYVLPVFGKKKV